jgi:RHS repeat-associated protein
MNDLRGITGRNFTYSDEDHLLTAGGAIYKYDLDGFLTTKTDVGVTSYDYSSRGELLSVTLPDGRVIEYIHDPLGRRVAKKVDGTIVEKYFWQGLTRLLAVYDGSNNLLMRFEYADARMPVAMTKGGSTYYLTYDQVGSLRIVADASGNVLKLTDYDSFGNIINDSNPTFEVPFGFAGGLYDKDIGLIRFGYRDYDPDIGRWTAKDPIGFAGGDTDLYGYCLGDPVNWVDPTGDIAVTTAIVVGTGVVAVGTFICHAYKAFQKGKEQTEYEKKLHEEYERGLPDPEYAEELKEDADKSYNEFLDEMRETVKKGMKVPKTSACP